MKAIESIEELSNIKHELKKEQRQLFKKRLLSNKLMVTGGVTLIFLTLVAFIGPLFMTYNPYEMVVQNRLQAPSTNHLLGTDEFGRDLLTRIVFGAK